MIRFGVWVAILASSASAGAQEVEESPERQEARAHFEQGLLLMQNENWEAALIEFSRSVDRYPTRSALFNLGNCQKALHRYADALRTFQRWTDEFGATAGEEERASVEAAVAGLEGFFGSLRVNVDQPDAQLFLDGRLIGTAAFEDAIPVEVGRHVVEVRLDGFRTATRPVEIASRESQEIFVELEPASGDSAPDPVAARPPVVGSGAGSTVSDEGVDQVWFWTCLGVAVAAGVAGGVTGGLVLDRKDAFDDAVGVWRDNPTPEYEADARAIAAEHDDFRLATNVLLPVAGAFAAAALVLAFLTDFGGDDAEAPEVTAAPSVSPDGAGFGLWVRF